MNFRVVKFDHADFNGHKVVYDRERHFGWVEPEVTPDKLIRYYRDVYRVERNESVTKEYVEVMGKRAEIQHAHIIENSKKQIRSVLEIGSGAGLLLAIFCKHARRVVGFEADPLMCAAAQLNAPQAVLHDRYFTENSLEGERFDLVVLSHVLEHFSNPKELLTAIRSILTQRGCVFIEVPNDYYESVKIQCKYGFKNNAHLSFFTTSSLTDLLIDVGFGDHRVATYGGESVDLWKSKIKNSRLKSFLSRFYFYSQTREPWDYSPSFKSRNQAKGAYIRALAYVS
jgi:2-polyprenyl-3-methyl-5-hydroxy-6-metoxy-1,4-benzoquinol methylase